MKLLILDAASQDLIEGYRFYERQQGGLGGYFLDALYSDIDSLLLYAGIHAVFYGQYHRALSKRFPFAIYYRASVGWVEQRDTHRLKCWVSLRSTQPTDHL